IGRAQQQQVEQTIVIEVEDLDAARLADIAEVRARDETPTAVLEDVGLIERHDHEIGIAVVVEIREADSLRLDRGIDPARLRDVAKAEAAEVLIEPKPAECARDRELGKPVTIDIGGGDAGSEP